MTARVDSGTGLRLVSSPPAHVYRIAKSSYGPMNPPVREDSKKRTWNRWDTPGRTVYASDSAGTAYIEALAWAHEEAASRDRAIRKTAELFGVSPQKAREMVEADWLKAGSMQPGWLPTIWRDGRRMYQLTLPDGWWVGIARWLREEVTLDDGTQPLGVPFTSKYGRSGEAQGTS